MCEMLFHLSSDKKMLRKEIVRFCYLSSSEVEEECSGNSLMYLCMICREREGEGEGSVSLNYTLPYMLYTKCGFGSFSDFSFCPCVIIATKHLLSASKVGTS